MVTLIVYTPNDSPNNTETKSKSNNTIKSWVSMSNSSKNVLIMVYSFHSATYKLVVICACLLSKVLAIHAESKRHFIQHCHWHVSWWTFVMWQT